MRANYQFMTLQCWCYPPLLATIVLAVILTSIQRRLLPSEAIMSTIMDTMDWQHWLPVPFLLPIALPTTFPSLWLIVATMKYQRMVITSVCVTVSTSQARICNHMSKAMCQMASYSVDFLKAASSTLSHSFGYATEIWLMGHKDAPKLWHSKLQFLCIPLTLSSPRNPLIDSSPILMDKTERGMDEIILQHYVSGTLRLIFTVVFWLWLL